MRGAVRMDGPVLAPTAISRRHGPCLPSLGTAVAA
jgi:hypothetical protein